MVNELLSLSVNSEARYSNGPDSGCLVRVGDNVVAAEEGENHPLLSKSQTSTSFRWPGLPSQTEGVELDRGGREGGCSRRALHFAPGRRSLHLWPQLQPNFWQVEQGGDFSDE